ncbi:MAG: DegT/DnrJ/EryC1/StrS family aminotransferase [Vicinamibacterales bacterium]
MSGPRIPRERRFITFGSPRISRDDVRAVSRVLRSGWLGTGPMVHEFERAFARYKGADHAVAVSSCTAALHLALLAAGIGPGDEVITTPLTFCATVNAIIHAGAVPVLVDVDPRTMNLDHELLAPAIHARTKAIVPVHFAGLPCDTATITSIAARHGLTVIEDCAHALESESHGTPTGTAGDFGCFSFYVTKNITTGEGGMVLARSAEQAEHLRRLALHGLSAHAWARYGGRGYRHYTVTAAGFKYNMTDIQAALGLSQLRRIDAYWRRRRALWRRYVQGLRHLPLPLPPEPAPGVKHAYHLFTVLVDPARLALDRDTFTQRMAAARIGVGVHYRSIAGEAFYRERFNWRPEEYPHADRIGGQTVSLPMSARMTTGDVDRVVGAIDKICTAALRTGRRQRRSRPAAAAPDLR